ncbi:type VII toxin-antitoxin system MntA family adenylyltransferase antitoxin [Rubrivirga litoralis]|uniref:Nucleotidyltransferase domain-containing protein n=1 Tax=Rubrivirga litoralis TaxID=3075598 RepID=A0ABU3BN24_9BACT|nr:nucleotidyltransferase domain-containing protein [Rubrivirga sp. F394]MDT0630678.1 nucleotidyltransferase domain-containing protein [Rubrivirga sp. F394]
MTGAEVGRGEEFPSWSTARSAQPGAARGGCRIERPAPTPRTRHSAAERGAWRPARPGAGRPVALPRAVAPPDLRPLLDRVPSAQAVYLFGSRAGGAGRADSDLDLAVLPPRPMDPVERFDAQEALAAALGVDVDLRSASTVMRAEVLRTGRVVYDADPTARALAAPSLRGLGSLDDVGLRALERGAARDPGRRPRAGPRAWLTTSSSAGGRRSQQGRGDRAVPPARARGGRRRSWARGPDAAGRGRAQPSAGVPGGHRPRHAPRPRGRGGRAADQPRRLG